MVNTVGMQGEINRNELRSAKLVHFIILDCDAFCFSEVNILKTLRDVKCVAQLICYDVLYSQEHKMFGSAEIIGLFYLIIPFNPDTMCAKQNAHIHIKKTVL